MSEPLLKTRHVFVDTEAYEHQKFRFDHPALKKLRDLGSAGFLRILTTDVVDGEVRQHIRRTVANAVVALDRFHNHAGVLQANSSDECRSLFKQIEESHLAELGIAVWEGFLEDAKVEIVRASTVHALDLLNLYFAQLPPFSERKKAEFPDAISVLSLDQWRRDKEEQEIYLIGDDPDIKAWCNAHAGMHHIKSLNEFLDLYNRAEDKLAQLALDIFEKEKEWIDSVVDESFLECAFVFGGNWEAEVENVEVTSSSVDDVNVIEVDEHRFVLAINKAISFSADVSGPDYDRGSWDSEDKRYMHLPTFHSKVTSADTYDVSFEIEYDIANESATRIKDVMFNDGKEIRVRDEFGWPYK
jgi:hypothetical protein